MPQNDTKRFSIAVIPGDGIGREVIPAAVTVLNQVGARFDIRFDFRTFDWGSDYYFEHGSMMPTNALESLRSVHAILLGAIGLGAGWLVGGAYGRRQERGRRSRIRF